MFVCGGSGYSSYLLQYLVHLFKHLDTVTLDQRYHGGLGDAQLLSFRSLKEAAGGKLNGGLIERARGCRRDASFDGLFETLVPLEGRLPQQLDI